VTVTIEGVLAACTTLLAVSAVLAYLRDHLVTPVAEVREQVKNTHESNLREDIDGLAGRMDRLADSFDQARREDRQRWREHMAYSASIAERIERLERQRRPDDN
jgi:hypothetical protein